MSLNAALGAATSGLAVTSRSAEVTAANIANALTEGYARREVVQSARALGSGVEVKAVSRVTDPGAAARRRGAEAEAAAAEVTARAETRIAGAWGGPDDPTSIPLRAAALETALARLADTPESGTLQTAAATAARDLVAAFNTAAGDLRALREQADAAAARLAGDLDSALQSVVKLNRDILAAGAAGGRDLPALTEARDRAVDRIAEIVPIRTAQRDHGAVALYTANGALLLDGRAVRIGFDPAMIITPDMTLASGALSPLTLDGDPIKIGEGGGPLDGGALSAWFGVRDGLAPAAGVQLDAVAADLIARFADPAVDPTLAPGDAGLFTDAGGPLAVGFVPGLAGRLAVNAAVDPAQGGAVWRMRDGLGAVAPGPAGVAARPRDLLDALGALRPAPIGSGLGGAFGLTELAGGAAGLRMSADARAETAAAEAVGRRVRLTEAEAAMVGVTGDDELARLLRIEQSYAANARVIATVDAMLRRLMEI